MLQDCVQLQNQRLGPSHPNSTVTATATLKRWQEQFEIASTSLAQIYIQRNLISSP